jgi:hypothetical protein
MKLTKNKMLNTLLSLIFLPTIISHYFTIPVHETPEVALTFTKISQTLYAILNYEYDSFLIDGGEKKVSLESKGQTIKYPEADITTLNSYYQLFVEELKRVPFVTTFVGNKRRHKPYTSTTGSTPAVQPNKMYKIQEEILNKKHQGNF